MARMKTYNLKWLIGNLYLILSIGNVVLSKGID